MTIRRLALFIMLLARRGIGVFQQCWMHAAHQTGGGTLASGVRLVRIGRGRIDLAAGVVVGHGTLLIAATQTGQDDKAVLKIGLRSAINEYCNLRAGGGDIIIGDDCMLAQFVTIVATNHGTRLGEPMIRQPWATSRRGVIIGNDVWIGANVVVLPGVRIGNGAVVAAGAVVNTDIPAQEIWGGVPARRISSRHPG
jgi:carbonic anhydrase/acetyltransferase-like protein (isoleucine patch superfamily)